MFKTGLIHGVIVLAIVALATFASVLSKNADVVSLTMFATAVLSWISVGYLYEKHCHSLGAVAFNKLQAKNNNSFWLYIFGIGLIWGPAKFLFAGYPTTDISILANIMLIIIAIPVSGIAVIFPVLIGSWLYKRNKTASNNSLKARDRANRTAP